MATIVYHTKTKSEYLLIGTGFAAFKSARSNAFLHLVPAEEEGQFEVVALSDASGNLHWARSLDVRIVEVDGRPPSDLLSDYAQRAASREKTTGFSDEEITNLLSDGSP